LTDHDGPCPADCENPFEDGLMKRMRGTPTDRRWARFVAAILLFPGLFGGILQAGDDPARHVSRLFLIGDSTVKNGTKGQQGWGGPFAALFDASRIRVENRARGGRSSRTFLTEGLWDQVLAEVHSGDFVLIQFGHNDGGSLTDGRARASLKGNSGETREVPGREAGTTEVVHTYGWYLRKYAAAAKAKGATPVIVSPVPRNIIVSPVPRNIWRDDRTVARASNDYSKWAAEAARQAGTLFLDLNELVSKKYEEVGREKVASQFFGADHTHTTPAGARVTAEVVAEGLKGLNDSGLDRALATPTSSHAKPASGDKP